MTLTSAAALLLLAGALEQLDEAGLLACTLAPEHRHELLGPLLVGAGLIRSVLEGLERGGTLESVAGPLSLADMTVNARVGGPAAS